MIREALVLKKRWKKRTVPPSNGYKADIYCLKIARKLQQMRFRDKTAYFWGLGYCWDPSLSWIANPISCILNCGIPPPVPTMYAFFYARASIRAVKIFLLCKIWSKLGRPKPRLVASDADAKVKGMLKYRAEEPRVPWIMMHLLPVMHNPPIFPHQNHQQTNNQNKQTNNQKKQTTKQTNNRTNKQQNKTNKAYSRDL